jgi:MHS family proline/betaine transporter-like MFS transporter
MFSKNKILIASILGNALEFYDFTLYGVLALVVSKHYFPGPDDTAQLLFSLTAFAIGFFTRPIGAMFFGHLGDTIGRKEALSLSILLMGAPTFLIGITPTYQQIGLWASISIFLCRLLQGVFTGGEYNGAAIFSIEHFGKKSSGFIGGLITGSCVIGALGATFFGAWTQSAGLPEWAWRIPFIFGGILGLFGYFMRRRMEETPEFTARISQQQVSLFQLFRGHPYSSFTAFMFGSFNGALTYTLFGFLNIYLSRYLQIPLLQAMQLNLFGLSAFMIGSPCMGYLLDLVGKRKFLMGATLSIFLLVIPIFLLLESSLIWLGQILLGLCAASIAGSCHAIMQELFPVKERYRGISLNFSMGMGLFGGITPIIYVHMIERSGVSLLFPALFLMGLTVCFAATITTAGLFGASKPIVR